MPESSEVIDSNAYLVIRQDGKWTDMFRLQPGTPIIIGRSSRSQIVVRSDQASRAHAEVAWQGGRWLIRDLGSRNGTIVNNATIRGEQALQERDIIAVAGHQLTFVTRLGAAFTAPDQDPTLRGVVSGDDDGSPTQEQIDPTLITHRRGRSTILDPNEIAIAASHEISLLRTAFALARSDSPEKAADIALDAITAVTHVSSGAVLLLQRPRELSASKATTPTPALGNISALAARSHQGHSYRRLSDKIVRTVLESGEAVLARNLQDDVTLTSPDSQGELSTSSTLCAPIRVDQKVAGLLHIYSRGDEPELQSDHLEWALAIAAHLGLTLEQLWRERSLRSNLRKSQEQLTQLRQQLGESVTIVGESPAILEIQRQVARAAPTSATVLVRGESGVGKELIAAAIHYASSRRNGPFVCLNCAALSPSLLESELFGHEKGAFTGATERKIGKFEAADGGTLMLDEIGEMNPEIQAKFLRVLEGQPFERVGGNAAIKVDVRVVAATNRDLEQAVRDGVFRSDLYFRLHVLELRVPPLRERGDDVLMLARHFLQRFREEIGRRLEDFSPSAAEKLLNYDWPGNIRELRNTIERAVVLCPGPRIEAEDLLLTDLRLPGQGRAAKSIHSDTPPCDDAGVPITLAELEREHIDRVLRFTDGNKSQAARILGIERSTLDRKLKRSETD